ncbi:MAG: DUF4258 domain-containing protein [Calditrichaeota bacterium]|nr:DUF4258 domain-containing protein [Calditrichota bacterium]
MSGKEIIWLEHAKQNQIDREIPIEEIQRTLESPTWCESSYSGRTILMRIYQDPTLNQEMLLRIVIEETTDYFLIITVYKTSNINRYIRRNQ